MPLYTLAVAVDDVLMGITHMIRGEDLLSSTPRQVPCTPRCASGRRCRADARFGHLPIVLGEGGSGCPSEDGVRRLDRVGPPAILAEAIVNYLALLGWSLGDDREVFTLAEMVAAFDLSRVNSNSARFDLRKLEAINGDKIRALPADEQARITPFLQRVGLVADPPTGTSGGDRPAVRR